jgi:hypothetical protein
MRAESGGVVVESIDESLVTVTVNAILEDGTPVRGRMTVGGECP